jgi:hypothetical protein
VAPQEDDPMMIQITLTAANMGDVDEVDFDCWASFVVDEIDNAMGFEVAWVDQAPWGRPQPAEDAVQGGAEEQRAAVRRWLANEGWETFCGEEWARRRAAREAA